MTKPQNFSSKKLLTFNLLIAGIVLSFLVYNKINKSKKIQPSQIPEFREVIFLDDAVSQASKLIFKSHYLSRLIGSYKTQSTGIDQIANSFFQRLSEDKEIKGRDKKQALQLLAIMRTYQDIRLSEKSILASYTYHTSHFWSQLASLADWKGDSKDIAFEKQLHAKNAAGEQLEFWKAAQKVAKSSYLNDFRQAEAFAFQDEEPVSKAVEYLKIFEETRINSKLDSEDQIFCRLLERLFIRDWVLRMGNGLKLTKEKSISQAVRGFLVKPVDHSHIARAKPSFLKRSCQKILPFLCNEKIEGKMTAKIEMKFKEVDANLFLKEEGVEADIKKISREIWPVE